WASENCDAFIVFRSFPSQENAPENSNQNWSSLRGSDQVQISRLPLVSYVSGNGQLTLYRDPIVFPSFPA
ncbi:hypothetical protein CN234_31060, partial [Sinorhizobium meliloti]|uniref:hypothetical protein n=1 Tax=Rhizobium meliloti TaxID=382 RepID=UPI000FDB4F56